MGVIVSRDEDGNRIYPPQPLQTKWLGPYDSGETCEANLIWPGHVNLREGNTIEIKVRAKDKPYGKMSEWSEPITVEMPRINSFSFFEKLQALFPNLFLLFQKFLIK
jgi:hypothetical protein